MFQSRQMILSLTCLCGVFALLLVPSGCDLLPNSGDGGTGTLQLLITDAPFPFSLVTEATVTITRIEVRQDSSDDGDTPDSEDGTDDENENDNTNGNDGNENDNGDAGPAQAEDNENNNGSDGENENENDNGSEDGDENENENENGSEDDGEDDEDQDADEDATAESGDGGSSVFVTILDEEVSFDLLDLQNGVTASLASSSLSAGTYSQMRLFVSSGHVVLADGREFDLTVPSGEQTGIKLRFNFTITDDETTTLLLDVDVSKAFVPIPGGDINDASQIQSFLFKPSLAIRVTELESTGTASGQVTDETDAPLAGVAVTVYLEDVEVTTTATAEDGSYVLIGLEPGTYSIMYSLADFADLTVSDVEIVAGADTAVDPVVLVAE